MAKKKTNKKEESQAKPHNILEIKKYLDFKYKFMRNELSQDIEVKVVNDDGTLGETTIMDDPQLNSIWIDLQVNGFKCGNAMLVAILNSKLTESYHPLRKYFETLEVWDGETDYIQQLCETIEIAGLDHNGVKLRDLWHPYLKKWLIAAVGSAMSYQTAQRSNVVNHCCLVLVSRQQGKGKTTWLNRLCPESMRNFLVTGHIEPTLTNNNTANLLAERWLINIDDQLETIFGKDFNSMKSLITVDSITNRKVFTRFTKRRPRVASFMASVNNAKFLTDSQNRRYMVFTTDKINFQHEINIDMVWAQAVSLLKAGEQYWLSQEDIRKLNEINDIYRQVTPEEEWLQVLFKPTTQNDGNAVFLQTSQILTRLNIESNMKLSIKKLSQAMEILGYGEPVSKRLEGGQPRKAYPVLQLEPSHEEAYQDSMKEKTEKLAI